MKRLFLYLTPLLVACLVLVLINEYCRRELPITRGRQMGYPTMNSAKASLNSCSWECYHNTAYCKQNHVKVLNDYFPFLDPLYFGMIRALKMTGNYGAANVVFLVILWPLFMSFLFVRSLLIQGKIKKLKN